MADGGATVVNRDFETREPERATPGQTRLQRWRRPLLLLGPLLVAVAALAFYLLSGRYVSIDNAYVKSDVTTISTDVPGIVAEVAVHDNQPVKAGQLLYRLDDEPYRNAVASAQAQLATARNEIEGLRATYRQRQQDIRQAEIDVAYYQREFQRQSDLARSNVASKAALDTARHNLATAQQKLASLQQEAAGVLASLSGNPDVAVEDHPRYQAAKAQLDQAMRDLSHTRVTAPVDGIVTNVDSIQVGEYLQAAVPAFSLVASNDAWVEANPKETDLTHVEPGQPVTVTVDTYPDYVWHGTVAGISPATGAQFAILPPQNASGNWVKVVQRIPLRVALDAASDAPPLRAGMSATVKIDTGRHHTFFGLIGHANASTGQQ
jgi:membrane fusion protein (multidrug efflux system)